MEFNYTTAEQPLKGEDRILARGNLRLFGVFDGLGGYPGGDVAAQLAADTLAKFCADAPSPQNPPAAAQQLRSALIAANEKILTAQKGVYRGMSTTATVVRLYPTEAYYAYAHAGDSRLYHLRTTQLEQLTQDEGEGNLINNFLGGLRGLEQFGTKALKPGDRLLLCSDGVTGDWDEEKLSPAELTKALSLPDLKAASERLVAISRKRDDKSVVIIQLSAA